MSRLPDDFNLREMNFGDWELKLFKEIDQKEHERVFAFYESPGNTKAPGGENWNEFCHRTNLAIDNLITTYPDQPLIIVVHFGVIISQLQRAEGSSAKHAMRHRIDNFSLTQLRYHDAFWSINRLNFSA